LNVTCTLATCFWVLVPVNQTIIEVKEVPICAPSIIIIAIGKGINQVLRDAITIVLVAVLDWITIVTTIPSRRKPIIGRSRYIDKSKRSLTIWILSFIIPRPNNNKPNPKRKRAAALNFFLFPKINNENQPKTISGRATADTSTLNHKNATIQDVVVVHILAHIMAPIAPPKSIIFAPTNPKTIIVIIVLLWEIPEAIEPETMPFNGVFVVLRRSLLSAILPICFILSENICIPNKNILNHPNNSRQEKLCSMHPNTIYKCVISIGKRVKKSKF